MRINNITPVAFGYSKKSQSYLDRNIQTLEDKNLADTISKCSAFCNETEDLIKEDEKKQTPTGNAAADLYVAVKDALICTVMLLFDDSEKYLQSEYDYYSSSLKRCKNQDKSNWRSQVIDKLRFWDSNLGKSEEELKAELKEAEEYKNVGKKQVTDVIKEYAEAISPDKAEDTTLERLERGETSPKGFCDIVGMEDLKRDFIEDIVKPVNDPDLRKSNLVEYGKKIPSGILLYGPPGCGKTFIIEALAAEIDTDVYLMDIGNTGSKFINQTSNNIKKAFDFIKKKGDESEKPVILFMDEMDSMTFERNGGINEENLKQVATMLKSIEEAQKHNVIVIGASNKFDLIDPAIRRKFEVKEYVGIPDFDQRKTMLHSALKDKTKAKALIEDDEALSEIAKDMSGYSYHSINIITKQALTNALRRGRADITLQDFAQAIKDTNEEKINEKEYKPKDSKRIGFAASPLFVMDPKK